MGSIAIDMKTLSSRQIQIAYAVAATLFEKDDASPVPKERLEFAMEELRAFAAKVGLQTRLAFKAAFVVLQLAPFLMLGKVQRFTRLSAIARRRCLQKLEASRLGLVVVLLKTVLSFVYFEHPDALAGTGYDAEGLLGPAWAAGTTSPISKLKLRVIENPTLPAPGEQVPDVAPVPAAAPGRAAGGS